MQDEFLVAAAVAYVRYSSFAQSAISIEAIKRREEKDIVHGFLIGLYEIFKIVLTAAFFDIHA